MGGFLSSLLSVGTQAGGDYAQAEREASQMKLQQAINAMLMQHNFAKDAAQMSMNTARGHYYDKMASQPDAQEHVEDPVTGNVTFFDPRNPPANLKIHPKPQQPAIQLVQDPNNPTGPGVFVSKGNAIGQHGIPPRGNGLTGNANAAMASKSAQFGEMLKKTVDLLPAMQALDVKLGQSAAADVAQHGAGIGPIRIPGTRGIGSMLMNQTPEFAQYQAALAPWTLAAAHAISGARINQDQLAQLNRSVEMQPSDPPNVRQQRIKNVVDQLNSIAGSLPAEDVAAQEGQMDPATLQVLREHGYRGGGGHSAPAAAPPFTPAARAPRAKAAKDYGIFGGQ